MAIKLSDLKYSKTAKAFCATGEGGGVDPSCSPGEGRGEGRGRFAPSEAAREKFPAMTPEIRDRVDTVGRVVNRDTGGVPIPTSIDRQAASLDFAVDRVSNLIRDFPHSKALTAVATVEGKVKSNSLTRTLEWAKDESRKAGDKKLSMKDRRQAFLNAKSRLVGIVNAFRSSESWKPSAGPGRGRLVVNPAGVRPFVAKASDLVWSDAEKAFCPTGEGGGVDPSCPPKGERHEEDTARERDEERREARTEREREREGTEGPRDPILSPRTPSERVKVGVNQVRNFMNTLRREGSTGLNLDVLQHDSKTGETRAQITMPPLARSDALPDILRSVHAAIRDEDMPIRMDVRRLSNEERSPKVADVTFFSKAEDDVKLPIDVVEKICPACAKAMREKGFKAISAKQLRPEAIAALCEKYGDEEGFRTRCMEDPPGGIESPAAFCNWLKRRCMEGAAEKAFCPTGEGGGIDPSCSPGEGRGDDDNGGDDDDETVEWNSSERGAEDLLRNVLIESLGTDHVRRTESYEEAGVLTRDRGIVMHMRDGSEFRMTIVQSNEGGSDEDRDQLAEWTEELSDLRSEEERTGGLSQEGRQAMRALERKIGDFPLFTEEKFESRLRDILEGDVDEPGEGPADIESLTRYEDAGLMTRNRGVVVETKDGSEFQVTIHQARGPRDRKSAEKAFCPTGEGGGVDPSCSPGEGRGGGRREDTGGGLREAAGGVASAAAAQQGMRTVASHFTPGAAKDMLARLEGQDFLKEGYDVLRGVVLDSKGRGKLLEALFDIENEFGAAFDEKYAEEGAGSGRKIDSLDAKKIVASFFTPGAARGLEKEPGENIMRSGLEVLHGSSLNAEGRTKLVGALARLNRRYGKAYDEKYMEKAFCPTGEGGGVDPSCSPKGEGGGRARDGGALKPVDPKDEKQLATLAIDAMFDPEGMPREIGTMTRAKDRLHSIAEKYPDRLEREIRTPDGSRMTVSEALTNVDDRFAEAGRAKGVERSNHLAVAGVFMRSIIREGFQKSAESDATFFCPIVKASRDAGYVLAPVLVPETVDLQGDIIDAEEIERAAFDFMENFQNVGIMHKQPADHKDIVLVENYILRNDEKFGDVTLPKGTWMAGFRIYDDKVKKAVKEGRLKGLSIGGTGTRIPVDKAFCPTGEGGGVDPTCPPKGEGGGDRGTGSRLEEEARTERAYERVGIPARLTIGDVPHKLIGEPDDPSARGRFVQYRPVGTAHPGRDKLVPLRRFGAKPKDVEGLGRVSPPSMR